MACRGRMLKINRKHWISYLGGGARITGTGRGVSTLPGPQ
jgi:hypothetical protein